ncbi:hypothetical protein U1Q18_034256 [Sarracenia purpurea var. burkii]
MVLFGECGWFFEEACCHGLEGGLLFQPWFCLEDCCLKNARATFSLLTTLKGNCSKFMGNFLSAVNCFPAVVEDLKHFRSICCLESWCSCGCVVVMLNMFKASCAMVFVKDFRFAWRSSWPGLAEEIC